MTIKIWNLSLVSLFATIVVVIAAPLDVMRERVVEIETSPTRDLLAGKTGMELRQYSDAGQVDVPAAVSRAELKSYLDALGSDGRFSDIDYDSKVPSSWPVMSHCLRLRKLAVVSKTYPAPQNEQAKEAFHLAMGWWMKNDPKSPNWWSNEIGVPRYLGTAALVMGDQLDEAELAYISKVMARAEIKKTGQNRLWLSLNVLLHGLITGNEKDVAEATEAALSTAEVTSASEGIQPDASFRQHGAQFYQGNYGHHYLLNIAYFLKLVDGTPYEGSKEQSAAIEKLALDGTRWMMWGEVLDYATVGRQIAYSDRFQGPPLARVCEALAGVGGMDRAAEFSAWGESIQKDSPMTSLSGTRHFWRSDYAVTRSPEMMASVKMCSQRVKSTETTNSENLKGAYLCEGMTLLYRDGDEYHDIFPVWDWTSLPGVTSRSNAKLPAQKEWAGKNGKGDFVGGVSGDTLGMVAMDARRFGVSSDKIWVRDGDDFLMWTSGITSGSKDHVVTTINQCLLRGEVLRGEVAGAPAVWHDGLAYFFPGLKDELIVKSGEQEGNWKSLSKRESGETVRKNVFLLAVDHGVKPNQASMVCLVRPMTKENFRATTDLGRWAAANAGKGVHIVKSPSGYAVAFHKAGKVMIDGHGELAVDGPCLVTITKVGDKSLISLADPTQKAAKLKLSLDGKSQTVDLPQGGLAGSTIGLEL